MTENHDVVLGAYNAQHEHGRESVGLFYTHVSARCVPFYTVSIPSSGEAAYVIDGLLHYKADLGISVHHTDGGEACDYMFALAHFLGSRFAPCVPSLADRKLYAFNPTSTWPALTQFIAGIPDDRLITAQRDDLLRLTASMWGQAIERGLG